MAEPELAAERVSAGGVGGVAEGPGKCRGANDLVERDRGGPAGAGAVRRRGSPASARVRRATDPAASRLLRGRSSRGRADVSGRVPRRRSGGTAGQSN